MWFKPKQQLSKSETDTGLETLIRDGIASQAMGILTGGAFLVAFAVKLGASNLLIGLLAAIGPLSQLVQIPAIVMVEKIRNRKMITLFAAGSARLCWLVIAASPLFVPPESATTVLLGLLIASSVFGAMAGCSWNSWMRDFIPENTLGSFFSKRMRISVGVGIVISLAAAGFLDLFKRNFPDNELWSYSILFLVGFTAGALGLYFISRIPEPQMAPADRKTTIIKSLSQPFRDGNFRKLIGFLCSWNFAVNLAGPFFMVYMLKRLELPMSWVIGLSIISQVFNFLFLRIWGKFADIFSNKSVLAVAAPLFILSIFAWTFTTMPEKYFLTVPLLIGIHAVMGLSSAGVSLAAGNISLKLAPKGQATSYLAANTIANSVAGGIAPILGGKFADFFAQRKVEWVLSYAGPEGQYSLPTLNLQQWDFFFALAFILGLYSIHRLALVQETGEVDEKVVMNELFAEVRDQVRTMTSIEGLRQMMGFPFVIIRKTFVPREKNIPTELTELETPAEPAEPAPDSPDDLDAEDEPKPQRQRQEDIDLETDYQQPSTPEDTEQKPEKHRDNIIDDIRQGRIADEDKGYENKAEDSPDKEEPS